MANVGIFEVFGYYKSSICSSGWPLKYTENEFIGLKYALRFIAGIKDTDWKLVCISYYPPKEKMAKEGAYIDFNFDTIPDMFMAEYNEFLEEEGKKITGNSNKKNKDKGKKRRF